MAEMPKYYKIHTDGLTVELEPIYTELAPVVRCKDCKHYWKNKNTPGYLDKCVTVSDDDYCSDGERKDGDDNEV